MATFDYLLVPAALVATAEPVPKATYFPLAEESEGYGLFRFYIPGFEFALCVGDKLPSEMRQLCCHNSARRLISVSRSPNYHAMSRFKRALDGVLSGTV